MADLKMHTAMSEVLKLSRTFPLRLTLPVETLEVHIASGNMCPHSQVFVSSPANKDAITDAMVGADDTYTRAYMARVWWMIMPDAGTRLAGTGSEFGKVFVKTVSQERLSHFVCEYMREIDSSEPEDRMTTAIPAADELYAIAHDTGTGAASHWLPDHDFHADAADGLSSTSIRPMAECCLEMTEESIMEVVRDEGVITSDSFLRIVAQFDAYFREQGVTGYYAREHGPSFLRHAYDAVTISDEGNPFVYQESMCVDYECDGLHVWYRKF